LCRSPVLKQVSTVRVLRSNDYRLPLHLQKHVFSLFNTVQVPPPLRQRYHVHPDPEETSSNSSSVSPVSAANSLLPVTVSFLNSLYKVPSNQGSGALSQSVFATNTEYFSPEDLNLFQTTYNQHVQAAIAINGHSTSSSQVSSRPLAR